ncbi:uncharacterized protein LOC130356430 isoform X2 [Hyla sarda]|uniref:uncharacterized protein LOC130356430 isoform X2 n=1 Tax=Hyla sarda TaxID=327740 RepID=UPI0024C2CEFA|nr:uncharacterized protein LOC130356430 isoform X2 [Hyla sarda]
MTQYWALVLPLLLISNDICEEEDTVSDDIGPHMIRRISQLLTPTECRHFYQKIIQDDEDHYMLLPEPPPENGLKEHGIKTTEDCTKVLKNWVESKVHIVSGDRVVSILYNVGRLDMALELTKTLTQDTILGFKKSMDKLRKTSQRSKSSLIILEDDNYKENKRQVRDC